jgi:hypothetical protein
MTLNKQVSDIYSFKVEIVSFKIVEETNRQWADYKNNNAPTDRMCPVRIAIRV